ncbi:MAG: CHASE2 domain-containing protein [Candidatus Lambdaproteobacteria bacterium]|nr:CHASE2 domain-containing protein [Candidatus Lambdaproteobacteria bacterium]
MLKRLIAPSAFKIALLITLVIAGKFVFDVVSPSGSFLELIDKKWVDFILKNRAVQPHSPLVAIATIDTKSVDKYGRWPWPRERMAQLIQALNERYKVHTIGLDIVFSEAEEASGLSVTDSYKQQFQKLGFNDTGKAARFIAYLEETKRRLDGDAKLGQAMGLGKNTVLGYFFFTDQAAITHESPQALAESAERIAGSEIALMKGIISPYRIPIGVAAESNIQKIFKGGIFSGFFNMNPDAEDGTVRRVHLLMRYKDNIYPSLDLQIVRHFLGASGISVEADENGSVFQIQIGDLRIFPDYDGSLMLNYKGPPQTFPHYSIYDIIEGNVPKEALEGRIVLVGATEIGIYDLRTAPVAVAYPGVEVHATLLDNILSDSYFRLSDANNLFTVMILLAMGVLLGVTLPNLKPMYGFALAIALLLGYTVAHRFMVQDLLTWTSAVYVALVIVCVWAGVTLFRFLVTDRDKRFIRGAFQQYLSPQVIEQIIENPKLLQLGGEMRHMTAFFSDVQGFSTISEKLTPGELVQLLNVYLTHMSNIVLQYGGTVDKYEGDAVIAFFGAPLSYEDHALRACHVSLDMQHKLAELREMWKKEGKPELKMRIGLNTGDMVVGNMGSENRMDYTMMGNAVNLAARLEGANKNYYCYTCISEFTYEEAKEGIEARELDLIRVIGIQTPVRIYELVARKGELDEAHVKGYAYFHKGLELYRQQQWDEAVKYFNGAMKVIPDDPPSRAFIERCTEFKKNPPPAAWDGVFVATSK